jgi:hypothetical protein
MTDEDLGHMHSLYEAMSVGSFTINWLKDYERERSDFDLQFNLAKLNRATEKFIAVASEGNPLQELPQHAVRGFVFCLETLNFLIQEVSDRVREGLLRVGLKLRTPITLLLDQTDSLAERVEDVLEAWQLSLDTDVSAKIDPTIAQLDKTKTEIPDWRKTLELISD